MDDIAAVVFILLPQMFQDSNFLLRLTMKSLLISDHFQSNVLVGFVIIHFQNLSKGTLSNHLENLVPISYVVMRDVDV